MAGLLPTFLLSHRGHWKNSLLSGLWTADQNPSSPNASLCTGQLKEITKTWDPLTARKKNQTSETSTQMLPINVKVHGASQQMDPSPLPHLD